MPIANKFAVRQVLSHRVCVLTFRLFFPVYALKNKPRFYFSLFPKTDRSIMSSSGVVSSEVHQDSLFLDAVRVLDDEDEEEAESGKFRSFSCHCHGFNHLFCW